MKLHTVIGDDNRRVMCGPAAIASITGKSISQVKEFIYKAKGKRYVCSMYPSQIKKTLQLMGYRVFQRTFVDYKPTFKQWRKKHQERDRVYLVHVTGHFIAVKNRMGVDNHDTKPVYARQLGLERKRVRNHFIVQKGESS